MPILHMETDSVRGVGQQLKANTGNIQAEYQGLNGSVQTLAGAWQGNSADQFMQQMQTLLSKVQQVFQQGDELANRLEKEVTEWERVAAVLGGGAIAGGTITNNISGGTQNHNFITPDISSSEGSGDAIPKAQVSIGDPLEVLGDSDSEMSIYKLNMDDLDSFDPAEAAAAIDTGGRPVMFMVHGWGNGEGTSGPDGTFKEARDKLIEQYEGLPEEERPIIIGVEWESGAGPKAKLSIKDRLTINPEVLAGKKVKAIYDDFQEANENSMQTGDKLGDFLAEFSRHNPESSVNVMAHSFGVQAVLEGLDHNENVVIDKFLAIQGATDASEVSLNGKYDEALKSDRVGEFGITHNDADRALGLRDKIYGYGKALGQSEGASGIQGANVTKYNLSEGNLRNETNILNHSNLKSDSIHEEIREDFFGKLNQVVNRNGPQDSFVDFNPDQAYA